MPTFPNVRRADRALRSRNFRSRRTFGIGAAFVHPTANLDGTDRSPGFVLTVGGHPSHEDNPTRVVSAEASTLTCMPGTLLRYSNIRRPRQVVARRVDRRGKGCFRADGFLFTDIGSEKAPRSRLLFDFARSDVALQRKLLRRTKARKTFDRLMESSWNIGSVGFTQVNRLGRS